MAFFNFFLKKRFIFSFLAVYALIFYGCTNHVADDLAQALANENDSDGDDTQAIPTPSGPIALQGFSAIDLHYYCNGITNHTLVNPDNSTSTHICSDIHSSDMISPAWAVQCPDILDGPGSSDNDVVTFQLGSSNFEYRFPCTTGEDVSLSLAGGEWGILCEESFGDSDSNGQPDFTYYKLDFFGAGPAVYNCVPGEVVSRQELYDDPFSPSPQLAFNSAPYALKCDPDHSSYSIRFTGDQDLSGEPANDDLYTYDCIDGEDYSWTDSGSGDVFMNITRLPVYDVNSLPEFHDTSFVPSV